MEETLSPAQAEVNQLVENGLQALDDFLKLDQDQVDYIVAKCSVAALDKHGELAKLAIEETKRGVFEDKATKNLFACEYVVNHMRHLKSVGVIKEDEVQGLTYVAEPVGVVAGVTPVTNPTSTAIFKSLICLKTRNPIIFGFHPNAQQCSVAAAKVVYEAAVKAGAPKNCIQWIEHPSMEATSAVSYTHLRAHETGRNLVCRLLLEKKKKEKKKKNTKKKKDKETAKNKRTDSEMIYTII